MKRHVLRVAMALIFMIALLLWGGICGSIRSCNIFVGDLAKTDEETAGNAAPMDAKVGNDEIVTGENDAKIGNDERTAGESGTESAVRQVALTFDDGPHAIYTPLLLDGLKERGVKATFFLMGQNIEGNEEIVKRMSEEGHLIGNHTYSHVQLTAVSEAEAFAEVEKDTRLIESITGVTVAYIRPPYGSCTQSLADGINLRIVLWDIDPRDWESQNASLVTKHILNHIGDGDIILLHDIFRSSVEAALLVIDELEAQGYEFVRVDELGIYE